MSHKSRTPCMRTACLLLLQQETSVCCQLVWPVLACRLIHPCKQSQSRQQKAASAIHLSKAFFRVAPVAEVQAGGTRHGGSTSRRSRIKKPQRCRTGDKTVFTYTTCSVEDCAGRGHQIRLRCPRCQQRSEHHVTQHFHHRSHTHSATKCRNKRSQRIT